MGRGEDLHFRGVGTAGSIGDDGHISTGRRHFNVHACGAVRPIHRVRGLAAFDVEVDTALDVIAPDVIGHGLNGKQALTGAARRDLDRLGHMGTSLVQGRQDVGSFAQTGERPRVAGAIEHPSLGPFFVRQGKGTGGHRSRDRDGPIEGARACRRRHRGDRVGCAHHIETVVIGP